MESPQNSLQPRSLIVSASPDLRKKPHSTPPPLFEAAEMFDGAGMLAELTGPLGVVLWKGLQNVELWALASPAERRELFSEGAARRRRDELRLLIDAEEHPLAPLKELSGVLDSYTDADPARVAAACGDVAQWAQERGAISTAVSFWQAAALAAPEDALHAVSVAVGTRMQGDLARSESWSRHARVVARRNRAREPYIRATIALGKVQFHRGALPQARRTALHAIRTARRFRKRELYGWALHDAAQVSIHAGRWAEAARFAREAFQVFGPRHPLRPRLLNDVSYWWTSVGLFRPALDLALALPPHSFSPENRITLFGTIARAAGGAGDAVHYGQAEREIQELSSLAETRLSRVPALLDLARGALMLGQPQDAAAHAEHAITGARETRQLQQWMEAEAVLESARAEEMAGVRRPADRNQAIPKPVAKLAMRLREYAAATP